MVSYHKKWVTTSWTNGKLAAPNKSHLTSVEKSSILTVCAAFCRGFAFIRFRDKEVERKVCLQRHSIDGRWCDIKVRGCVKALSIPEFSGLSLADLCVTWSETCLVEASALSSISGDWLKMRIIEYILCLSNQLKDNAVFMNFVSLETVFNMNLMGGICINNQVQPSSIDTDVSELS